MIYTPNLCSPSFKRKYDIAGNTSAKLFTIPEYLAEILTPVMLFLQIKHTLK